MKPSDWHLDEVFVTIQGRRQYLWRAVDLDGDVIDILVQPRRDRRAAKRFFRKLLKGQGSEPRRLLTDKLRSYGAAHRTVMPSVVHSTNQYENNRAEVSHQPTLVAVRGAGSTRTGRFIEYKQPTNLANLHLSLLQRLGLETEEFGTSDGSLAELDVERSAITTSRNASGSNAHLARRATPRRGGL